MSEAAPRVVPWTTTLTKGSGSPEAASVTVPVTVRVWADAGADPKAASKRASPRRVAFRLIRMGVCA